MSMVASPTRYTPADLLAMRDAKGVELIDGQLVEHEMGAKACRIAAMIIHFLQQHLRTFRVGELMTSEVGYQCFPDAPGMVRKPDISFIRAERYRPEYEEGANPPSAPPPRSGISCGCCM